MQTWWTFGRLVRHGSGSPIRGTSQSLEARPDREEKPADGAEEKRRVRTFDGARMERD